MARSIWRVIAAVFFMLAGFNHFRRPQMYLRIMPPTFPYPVKLVWISGLFEVIGGAGLLIPKLRQTAGWGLILLLIAVFPANLYMAMDANQFADLHVPVWLLWARLFLQPMLIAGVWWVAK